MSAITFQTSLRDPAKWITPEEQLQRLIGPNSYIIGEIAGTSSSPGPLPLPELAAIVAEYAQDLTFVSNWYKALERLNMLPKKVLALPLSIQAAVSDNDFLYLIPPGTLNDFIERVKIYGERHLVPNVESALQIKYFWHQAWAEHGDTPFREWQWILIKDIFPESRHKDFIKQIQIVSELSAKSFLHYEIASLKEAIAFVFLHKIATGMIFSCHSDEEHRPTYIRVQEATQGCQLVVTGGKYTNHLSIYRSFYPTTNLGVSPLRKLGSWPLDNSEVS